MSLYQKTKISINESDLALYKTRRFTLHLKMKPFGGGEQGHELIVRPYNYADQLTTVQEASTALAQYQILTNEHQNASVNDNTGLTEEEIEAKRNYYTLIYTVLKASILFPIFDEKDVYDDMDNIPEFIIVLLEKLTNLFTLPIENIIPVNSILEKHELEEIKLKDKEFTDNLTKFQKDNPYCLGFKFDFFDEYYPVYVIYNKISNSNFEKLKNSFNKKVLEIFKEEFTQNNKEEVEIHDNLKKLINQNGYIDLRTYFIEICESDLEKIDYKIYYKITEFNTKVYDFQKEEHRVLVENTVKASIIWMFPSVPMEELPYNIFRTISEQIVLPTRIKTITD